MGQMFQESWATERMVLLVSEMVLGFAIAAISYISHFDQLDKQDSCFPECVAKGSRLTLGGLGVEPCS